MLYREIIAVCSEIHKKHINTLRGQNVEFVSVRPGGTYINYSAVRRLSRLVPLTLLRGIFHLSPRHYVLSPVGGWICGPEITSSGDWN
jgi:hypothetical protein